MTVTKFTKWRKISWVLGIITLITVTPAVLLLVGAASGAPGSEYLAFASISKVAIAVTVILLNLILALTYIVLHKPPASKAIFPWAIVLIASPIVVYFGHALLSLGVNPFLSPADIYKSSEEKSVKERTISKEEVLAKIYACEVDYIYPPSKAREYEPASISPKPERDGPLFYYFDEKHLSEVDKAAIDASKKCGWIENSGAIRDLVFRDITAEKAAELATNCEIKNIYFPGVHPPAQKDQAALNSLSNNGVYLEAQDDGRPLSIGTNESQFYRLLQIVKEKATKCPHLTVVLRNSYSRGEDILKDF
ncbi:TPA: hypothetical protein DIS56_01650 [Candidatus Saccharibacteria bacterium]|nr:MAG: hypothetical protein A3F05_02515 [Candidatus Saccharibacteria bacterium RIFCSPHIGHO2_12_FULL_47_17]HCM51818.1 hypothetical protein [Candidatus Saccharibacteria bacterium]